MAIDQTPSTSPPDSSTLPAIENEFPAYRAISSTAVLSLIFGLASVFCFAHLWFLLLVAAAVGLGIYSIRQVRRLPDVLTGTGLATAGIGIGLLFGLCAVAQVVTQEVTINIDAGQFARSYIDVIKDEPISVALWYQQSPAFRNTKNPDEIVEELKKARSPASGDPYKDKADPIQRIKDRLKLKGEAIQYSQIESKAVDGLTTYANALLKLEGPGTPEHPEKEEYALIQLVRAADSDRLEWTVQEVKYPYTPRSAVAVVQKKDDDGHGH